MISFICNKVISTKAFEMLSLMIIFWNTIMLFLDDPYSETDIGNMFDTYFQSFYTIEMSLKIFALGFIWNEGSYLRNGWNILDFTIVVTGFIPYIMGSNSVKISGLRTLRVLRPLKTISSLYHLKMILMALFAAFPMIMNAVFILFFCLLMYAIAGLQLFMGALKKRCFDKETGLIIPNPFDSSLIGYICGDATCPDPNTNICGKLLKNPNSDITNFDTVLWSLLMMFQEITLENWSINMYYVAKSVSYYTVFFFLSLAFVGAMIFLNLLASIITQAYEEQSRQMQWSSSKSSSFKQTLDDKLPISIDEIKKLKFIERIHHKRVDRIKNVQYNYGAVENYVFVPKPNEIRWQDILDLKLQKLAMDLEKKPTMSPNNDKKIKKGFTEIDELLHDLDDALQMPDTENNNNEGLLEKIPEKNDEIKKEKETIETIKKKKLPINIIDIKTQAHHLPRKSGMNAFHGNDLHLIHNPNKDISKDSPLKTEPVQNVTDNEESPSILQSPDNKTHFDSLNKKSEENEINGQKLEKKDTTTSRTINFLSQQNNEEDKLIEKHITFSSKALSKFKIFSKFIQTKTKNLIKPQKVHSIKVIDYMLMIDFSKKYQSNSQKDVLVSEVLRKKHLEHNRLQEKLKNCKCNLEYLKNHIDISEFEKKRIKKQTMIMTHLIQLRNKTGRITDPKIVKTLLYGKKIKSSLKIPIASCNNDLVLRKRRKHISKSERKIESRFDSLKLLISKSSLKKSQRKKKRQSFSQKNQKPEKQITTYKEMKMVLKEKFDLDYNKEEVLQNFNNDDIFIEIKVFFFIFLKNLF